VLGEHVRERGFTALKTNIFLFDGGSPELYMPGLGRSPGGPELNPSLRVEEASRPRATSASSVRWSGTG
jgi:hypothetical protein